MRTFIFLMVLLLWSTSSFAKFELGWQIDSPWSVTNLRAKIKAIPAFVVLQSGNIDFSGTVTLNTPFSAMTDACGRNAEVEYRFLMKTRKVDELDPKIFKTLRASLTEKLMGLCPAAVELSAMPVLKKGTSIWVPWAKALNEAVRGDFPVKMLVPPLGEEGEKSRITKAIGVEVLKSIQGLNILLSGLELGKGEYRKLLAANLAWGNEQAATGKVITLIVSGAMNFGKKETSPDELPQETLEVVKSFAPKSLMQLCTGKLRFSVASDRINELKQDRAFAEIEKWANAQCDD